jgi:4a-hydroxytetrahydrobiopterin dehydratase
MMELADKKCVPCKGGVPPLSREWVDTLLAELEPGWKATHHGTRIERTYPFEEFKPALEFANRVGAIAEEEGHHPDLHVGWGRCTVEIWTHKINGLTESDFYLAAKSDRAYQQFVR